MRANGADPRAVTRRSARLHLHTLARLTFRLMAQVTVVGRENWPAQGPLIVVANHSHFGDPALMLSVAPVRMEFLAGHQLPGAPPLVKWIPTLWGALRVRRGSVGSRAAVREAEAILGRNGVLGIFPEAGSWAQTLRRARPGTAYLAARTGARIPPVGIDGMPDVLPSPARLRRAIVTVRLGAPFGPLLTAAQGHERREQLDAIGDTIMEWIATLLSPERRGLYSDDAALREEARWTEALPWEDLNG